MGKVKTKDIVVPEIKEGVKVTLIMVTTDNNNKYYNMLPEGDKITIEYGRIQKSKTTITKPIAQWDTVYKQKIRKGYKDTTELHAAAHVAEMSSSNPAFNEFFDSFAYYAQLKVKQSYNASSCTPEQLQTANELLSKISGMSRVSAINNRLLELYTIIPRAMGDVNEYLLQDKKDLVKIISREQDSLDSMDSANIVHSSDPLSDMDLDFVEVKDREVFYNIFRDYQYADRYIRNIHKVYEIITDRKEFEKEIKNSHSDKCDYLLHGTRNPNVFSIMKGGLQIRPSNAYYSGSAYGDGVYHSFDVAKSWNYTGHDDDKLMFVQQVNVGKQCKYNGWYSEGKSLSRKNMNYDWMKENGYDSLYVTPGGGLRSSEYVVYNSNQTTFKYLIWFKS